MRINNDLSMVKLYREANRNNNYTEKSLEKLSIGCKASRAKMESDAVTISASLRARAESIGEGGSALPATAGSHLDIAQSRVRDVDMAKEMLDFVKGNILNQAATAMLAQAPQQSAGVLQLLR